MADIPVSLALQGGGAHGAYAWGVLDALLEYTHYRPVAVSGASAGAMNAAALATGYVRGGRDGARETLAEFWTAVGKAGAAQNTAAQAWRAMLGNVTTSMLNAWAESFSQAAGPYASNPLNINPLRELVDDGIDCKLLRTQSKIAVHIAATSVRTGGLRLFTHKHINTDVLLASACLPSIFQAVSIDGEDYWDGGYSGNPPLWPLVERPPARDVIIIHINPLSRDDTPTSTDAIAHRADEISFNAPLLGELRAIHAMRRVLARRGMIQSAVRDWFAKSTRPARLHAITADAALGELGPDSKLKTDWDFLQDLHTRGRNSAKSWLNAHGDDVGRCDSLDLAGLVAASDLHTPPSAKS